MEATLTVDKTGAPQSPSSNTAILYAPRLPTNTSIVVAYHVASTTGMSGSSFSKDFQISFPPESGIGTAIVTAMDSTNKVYTSSLGATSVTSSPFTTTGTFSLPTGTTTWPDQLFILIEIEFSLGDDDPTGD